MRAHTHGNSGVRVPSSACKVRESNDDTIVHSAHKADPSIPNRVPDYDADNVDFPITFDNTKSKQILGITYIDRDTSTKDMVAQFKEKGWY